MFAKRPVPSRPVRKIMHSGIRALATVLVLSCTCLPAAVTASTEQPSDSGAPNPDPVRLLASGRVSDALPLLLQALAAATGDEERARIHLQLGNARFLLGDLEQAAAETERTLTLAGRLQRDDLASPALNNQGNIAFSQGRMQEALKSYRRAIGLARSSGQPLLAAEASINAARAALALKRNGLTAGLAGRAAEALDQAPADGRSAYARLALARLLLETGDPAQRPEALHQVQRALEIGRQLDDAGLRAYALGYIGALHEEQGRTREALAATGEALYAALGIERRDILYRLQWQAARLLRDLGRRDEAIEGYRKAIQTLQRIRSGLGSVPRRGALSFAAFGDLYYQLADLLLQRAAGQADEADAQPDLLAARDTIERLKAVELADYFRDECVTSPGAEPTRLDRLGERLAVIYPIILPDRTELLAQIDGRMYRHSMAVDRAHFAAEVKRLRRLLEKRTTRQYLPHARQLYRWLIEPLEARLRQAGVRTLVFVPDGALRLVPLAALHDGNGFLIERYRIATSPALVLTDPRPLLRDSPEVLLSGISRSVQGFPPLPAVREELVTIQQLFGGQVIEDEAFVKPRIRSELTASPYSIVHIATHGEIDGDVRKSYLLTFDSRLSMDELEDYVKHRGYRVKPVELLTLSACHTAAGDERAALGLAGIALKAGVRSAMATLWAVSDQAAARLVPGFYAHLADPGSSKAEALRQAQLDMIGGGTFSHPGYWAPFLLVGNWL